MVPCGPQRDGCTTVACCPRRVERISEKRPFAIAADASTSTAMTKPLSRVPDHAGVRRIACDAIGVGRRNSPIVTTPA